MRTTAVLVAAFIIPQLVLGQDPLHPNLFASPPPPSPPPPSPPPRASPPPLPASPPPAAVQVEVGTSVVVTLSAGTTVNVLVSALEASVSPGCAPLNGYVCWTTSYGGPCVGTTPVTMLNSLYAEAQFNYATVTPALTGSFPAIALFVPAVPTCYAPSTNVLQPPPTVTIPGPPSPPPPASPPPSPPPTPIFGIPNSNAQAQYGSAIVQQGNGNYSSPQSEPPVYDGTFARFVVLGDWGRLFAPQSVGLAQCPTSSFGGDNNVQGGLQQRETALLIDEVCQLIGGCTSGGVISTGDNFYECGVYPNDTTNRFTTDWFNVYKTNSTPNIAAAKWYSVFGNHDIVINGSVEEEISYSQVNTDWVLPSNYFTHDYSINGISVRGIFVDTNPFVTAYNAATNKYHSPYYIAHHNASYVAAEIAYVNQQLATSTATWNFVVGHYPIFGSATQYGVNSSSAFPGEFSGWAQLLQAITVNKATTYFNGHDHTMTLGDPTNPLAGTPWNNYTTYMTSGAGSWGEDNDSCGKQIYSSGGAGGFIIVSANATVWRADYYALGSTYSQCTVTQFADKTRAPQYSPNCALGLPNACCENASALCY